MGADSVSELKTNQLETNAGCGNEVGDHSLSSEWNYDPGKIHQEPAGIEGNLDSDDAEPLKVRAIIERHDGQSRHRLAPGTQRLYRFMFVRLAESIKLENLTRRQLAGPKGKQLLLRHLDESIPIKSWRPTLSGLYSYWTYGLNLPWPIDVRELPRLPPVRPRQTPPDSIVREWATKLGFETDDYLRLIWLFTAEYGLRPNQTTRLTWGHIQRQDDKPYAIVADGTQAEFKTHTPVVAWLPFGISTTLMEWEKKTPFGAPEDPILPWRSASGRYERRLMDTSSFSDHWLRLKVKWGLPKLRPCDLRHWVNSKALRVGLSRVALGAMCGHDTSKGMTYADWYDRPQHTDLLDDQKRVLPEGLLALITDPKTRLIDNLPPELVTLWNKLSAFEIGEFEVAVELGRLVREHRTKSLLYTQKQPDKVFKSPDFGCINSSGSSGEPIPECPAGPEALETLFLFSCSPELIADGGARVEPESATVQFPASGSTLCTPEIPLTNNFRYALYTKSTILDVLGTPPGLAFPPQWGT